MVNKETPPLFFEQKFYNSLTSDEWNELNKISIEYEQDKIKIKNCIIFTEYYEKIKKFVNSKISKNSSLEFQKISNELLKLYHNYNIYNEKNKKEIEYYWLCINCRIIFEEHFNTFFHSALFPYILDLFADDTIKNAYEFYWIFTNNAKEKNIKLYEQIILIENQLQKKRIVNFNNKILEKCSCYQNNIINYLPKVVGIKRKKITNKEFSKIETEQMKPHRGRKKKEIEENISIREEENRIIYEANISKTEKFILSIDKNKTITPAMLRTFIYILSIATPHIKTYSKIGNIIEMQEIKINLKKASYDLKINKKDWLKKHIIKTLDSFITVKAKSNYFDDEKSKKTKTERYILFDDYLLQDYKIKENEIIVTFNKLFTISLMKSEEMIIPIELFRIDLNKYPLAFLIGYYLLLHERRNQKNTAKINKDYIKVKIETLLFNSGRDINEAIKTNNTKKEKELSINSLQILKAQGILKDYKYKLNNEEYEANEIEDNKTFSEWREYTLCYKFSDMITEKLNEYNKRPQIRKSKTK